MTLLQLITRVGELINQSLTDDTKTITKTSVTNNLNIAYRECISAVIDADEEYQLRETNADLVENQSTYSLPTDCKKLLRIELAYESTTDFSLANKISIHSLDDPSTVFSTISPKYAVIANGYKLFPTPTASVTNGIKLYYYENIADMSEDASTVSLPLGYEHLPSYYAAAMAHTQLGNTVEANNLLGLYRAEIDRMKVELSPRVQGGEDFVIIREGLDSEY